MLTIYKSSYRCLKALPLESIERGVWISLVNPNSEELENVSKMTDVSKDFLSAALDEEERSRIEIEKNHILILINIPYIEGENSFTTLPLGIIITTKHLITVCLKNNEILEKFNTGNYQTFSTNKRTRFLLQILYKVAELYLKYLRYIYQHTSDIEEGLRKTMKNKALFQLLEFQKSLVYFTTALKDNGIVMEKLLRLRNSQNFRHLLRIYEEDEDLLEDVIIENRQATEMVEMHSNILNSMMGAFSSIISNNLNIVMKFLTTMTILLAIPTMMSGFWGMNVPVPFAENIFGFVYVLGFAAFFTTMISIILWKKQMF